VAYCSAYLSKSWKDGRCFFTGSSQDNFPSSTKMARPKLMKVLDTEPIWNNVELVTALVGSSDCKKQHGSDQSELDSTHGIITSSDTLLSP